MLASQFFSWNWLEIYIDLVVIDTILRHCYSKQHQDLVKVGTQNINAKWKCHHFLVKTQKIIMTRLDETRATVWYVCCWKTLLVLLLITSQSCLNRCSLTVTLSKTSLWEDENHDVSEKCDSTIYTKSVDNT